jgi:hypothetical protein
MNVRIERIWDENRKYFAVRQLMLILFHSKRIKIVAVIKVVYFSNQLEMKLIINPRNQILF